MSEQETTGRCVECGHPLPDGTVYCDRCGRLSTSATIVEPPRTIGRRAPASGVLQFTPLNHMLVVMLVVSSVFALVYWLNSEEGLMAGYATFIGLPLLIGVMTAYLTRPQSGIGMTLKVTTVILCVVCPLLREGSICILMAAPLFYGVAVLGYLIVDGLVRLLGPRRGRPIYCMGIVVAPFVAGALTTTPAGIRNPDTMVVTTSEAMAAPPEVVWDELLHAPLISNQFPAFLRLGFPLPKSMERLSHDTVLLHFDSDAACGSANLIRSRQVVDPARHRITFTVKKDSTPIAHWLTFETESFAVEPAPGGSRVTETTIFTQKLQPGIYWNPVECFGMREMHAYALASVRRAAESAGTTRTHNS